MMFKAGIWFLTIPTLAIAAACSSPTPTLSGPIITLPPDASGPATTTSLIVENRGGDAFNVVIAGNLVATVSCGQTATVQPGQGNVPALPWDLTVVRVSDNSTIVASRVVRLPQWL